MEQETKHKTKRALVIAGIATLSAFALIGLFAIGAIIGGCASANKTPEDAPSSIQEERRALAASEADAGEAPDLLAQSNWYHFNFETSAADGGRLRVFYESSFRQAFIDLAAGYYRVSFSGYGACDSCDADFEEAATNLFFVGDSVLISASHKPTNVFSEANQTEGHSKYVYLPAGKYFFTTFSWLTLSLVDTLAVPASDVLTLGEDWNPTAWASREAIGGYPVIHSTYATEANASAAYVLVGWDDVVFKTAADSAVFTGLRVRYRWLWGGVKYLYNGQTYTYSWPSNTGNYWLWPSSVEYRDVNGVWSVVAYANQDWDGSNYIITPRFNWVLPTYRTLGFIEQPVNPSHLSLFVYHSGEAGTGESSWQLSPTLYGVTFGEWFGLASWDSPAHDVGAGNAIGLISTAFTGMVPILGISIFPNITLGLLLFLPLIGGIIVLIIKAVSK